MGQNSSLAQSAFAQSGSTGAAYDSAPAPASSPTTWGGAPQWAAPAATAGAVGGGMLSAFGQLQAGDAQDTMAKYDAKGEMIDARIKGYEGGLQQVGIADKLADVQSRLGAKAGASGFAGGGSIADVAGQNAIAGTRDRLNAAYATAIGRARATNAANFYKWQGKQAKKASELGAFTSLLNTGSQVALISGGL